MGGAPEIPQQNLGGELSQILQLMPKFAQKSYGILRNYGEKFGQKDIELMKQFAPQYAQTGLGLTKQFAGQYAGAGLDIAKQYAPGYLQLNQQQMQQAIAGSPLLKELNAQALSQLQAGGKLTPEQERDVAQATRATFAARGNVIGNQAIGAELLNRDVFSRQRLQEAQQLAAGVQNLDLTSLAGLGGQVQQPNLPAYAGAPNFAAMAAPGAGFGPLAAGVGAVSGVTQPLMAFGQNVFDANQSAAAAQSTAAANKSAGVGSGALGAVGAIGGGLAMGL